MSNEIGKLWRKGLETFWDSEPTNDPSDGPIWCLGQSYNPSNKKPRRASSNADTDTSFVSVSQDSETSTAPTSISSVKDDPDLKEYDQILTPDGTIQDSPQHVSQPENIPQAENAAPEEHVEQSSWPAPFLDDFESRIWMTYRSGFPPIPRSQDPKAGAAMTFRVRTINIFEKDGFTSDTGWGCMIRSGQSVLANALSILRLDRDWRRGQQMQEERQLLSLFADDPKAPFSIHRFVEHGASACGKHPGEWFGPSATAKCIQALANSYKETGMKVYITDDGSEVYEDKFMEVAKSGAAEFTPTLILVGTRLGITGVTPAYHEALKASLQMPQSVGIAGGQPSASHYFVGTQASHLFYLDPHTTRPALSLHEQASAYTAEEISSCHTRRLRRIELNRMDPSMLIAFLICDRNDWSTWRQGVEHVQGKPVVRVLDHEPARGVERSFGAGGGSGASGERAGAVDEVVSCSSDEDDEATVIDANEGK